MQQKDLFLRTPLSRWGYDHRDLLPEGGFGAVLSRAGVGKTAFLVQLALSNMLRDKRVLHISLEDPVGKVSLWYKEIFQHLASGLPPKEGNRIWQKLLQNRLIMTFREDNFSVPKLEERITDLTAQDIFNPQILFVDGLSFDKSGNDYLDAFKALAEKSGLRSWFTVIAHREEEQGPNNIPVSLDSIINKFEMLIQLQPEGNKIHVNCLEGSPKKMGDRQLLLDPSTMLVVDL